MDGYPLQKSSKYSLTVNRIGIQWNLYRDPAYLFLEGV